MADAAGVGAMDPSGVQPIEEEEEAVDHAADDAFWAKYAPGAEPMEAGAETVKLSIKLPDGTR
jgi:hypothetical protein